jgi:hypothetical protein
VSLVLFFAFPRVTLAGLVFIRHLLLLLSCCGHPLQEKVRKPSVIASEALSCCWGYLSTSHPLGGRFRPVLSTCIGHRGTHPEPRLALSHAFGQHFGLGQAAALKPGEAASAVFIEGSGRVEVQPAARAPPYRRWGWGEGRVACGWARPTALTRPSAPHHTCSPWPVQTRVAWGVCTRQSPYQRLLIVQTSQKAL